MTNVDLVRADPVGAAGVDGRGAAVVLGAAFGLEGAAAAEAAVVVGADGVGPLVAHLRGARGGREGQRQGTGRGSRDSSQRGLGGQRTLVTVQWLLRTKPTRVVTMSFAWQ